MARNEEKQLARLNRFYLEKQKQEELKKRPPRPRLDTINTARDLRKWLPTITRDIEFYVKQMEVPCYTDIKIGEFQDKIQQLKQEYRAYLHKMRTLEPDVSATGWFKQPYAGRKRQADSSAGEGEPEAETRKGDSSAEFSSEVSDAKKTFVPIATPVLQNMPTHISNQYGFEPPPPIHWNANPETQDAPLQFGPQTEYPALCEGGQDFPAPQNLPLQFIPASFQNNSDTALPSQKQRSVDSSQNSASIIKDVQVKSQSSQIIVLPTSDTRSMPRSNGKDLDTTPSNLPTSNVSGSCRQACCCKTEIVLSCDRFMSDSEGPVEKNRIGNNCDSIICSLKPSQAHNAHKKSRIYTMDSKIGMKQKDECTNVSGQTDSHTRATSNTNPNRNPLNLDYSDSSDED